jgi:hypothetical protein
MANQVNGLDGTTLSQSDNGECGAGQFAHVFCSELAGAGGGWEFADIAFPARGLAQFSAATISSRYAAAAGHDGFA